MKYRVNNALSIRKIENEIFIFERDSSTIHTLNGIGSMIFELIKSGIDSEDIPQKIINEYEVSIETAIEDTKKYLFDLEKKKVITIDN